MATAPTMSAKSHRTISTPGSKPSLSKFILSSAVSFPELELATEGREGIEGWKHEIIAMSDHVPSLHVT
jgi:hypothetical protein